MPEVPALSDADPRVLIERIADVFADDGVLARTLPAFEPRPGQRHMANAVARALVDGGVLLVEAGTGTGKTLAYLAPAVLSGQRVLISTGTKNLQDQIYAKDLPALRDALGITIRATYMKGRGNYLCLHRFEALRTDPAPRAPADRVYLDQLAEWAADTVTGDRAEIEDLPDNAALWNDVAATSDNCVGTECPRYQDCYVTTMRQRAAESDVVIVNHHLLCADAAVRQHAFGEVIPACTFAIVDEAHQLEDVATQYFGFSVSNLRLDDLMRDGHRIADAAAAEAVLEEASVGELQGLLSRLATEGRWFFSTLAAAIPGAERSRLTADTFGPVVEPGRRLIRALDDLASALTRLGPASEDLAALGRRAAELQRQLSFILAANDDTFVYFHERRGHGIFLRASPIDVSTIVRELLLDRMVGTVLTSATLTVDASFHYLRSRLGIDTATELRLPSEFDYAEQAILYLPASMPPPAHPRFVDAVAREVEALLQVTEGRAFILFTSYANLHEVHDRLAGRTPYPLLVQGSSPRTVLLREFRDTPHAVLLATSSFWQGVDVVGDALSCVVIDKLPFASPSDPLTAARLEKIESEGGNPFADYQVPLAILALQQGFGRLLRHRADRGVLALFDSRLRSRGYGRRFLASLPAAPTTDDLDAVRRFFGV